MNTDMRWLMKETVYDLLLGATVAFGKGGGEGGTMRKVRKAQQDLVVQTESSKKQSQEIRDGSFHVK
jgi:hypothetical protein